MGALAVPLPSRVERDARAAGPTAYQKVVDAAVDVLKGGGSRWPVDTGRSKRAFRRTGSGFGSRVYNPVSYASFVEAKNSNPAKKTLAKATQRLIKVAADSTPARTREQLQEQHAGELVRAFTARQILEDAVDLRKLYVASLRRNRGRVRIPRAVSQLDRRIRRRASRTR